MARVNKLGTSYCGLNLEQYEVKEMKAYLAKKGWSAKRYLRNLVRADLQIKIKLKIPNAKT